MRLWNCVDDDDDDEQCLLYLWWTKFYCIEVEGGPGYKKWVDSLWCSGPSFSLVVRWLKMFLMASKVLRSSLSRVYEGLENKRKMSEVLTKKVIENKIGASIFQCRIFLSSRVVLCCAVLFWRFNSKLKPFFLFWTRKNTRALVILMHNTKFGSTTLHAQVA